MDKNYYMETLFGDERISIPVSVAFVLICYNIYFSVSATDYS